MRNSLPRITTLKTLIPATIINIILFLLLTLSLFAFKAGAQESTRVMTIVPPSEPLSLAPGETAEGTLKFINDSNETLNLSAFIRDYIVEDNQGTPVILPPDTLSNKYSASAWIGVSPPSFSVPPGTTQELRYFVQVPFDARPGGHYAAVMYQPTNVVGVSGTGTGVFTHIGTLFYIQVEGDIAEGANVVRFDAGNFHEYGPVAIETEIQNGGDLHIRPKGTITVKNMLGQEVASIPLEEHNIFPERSFLYTNEFGSRWMIGRYTLEFNGTYGLSDNLTLSATTSFVVFPWKVGIITILIIIIIILLIIAMRRKSARRDADEPKPHDASNHDRL